MKRRIARHRTEAPSGPAVVFGPPVKAGGKSYVPVSEEHGFIARPLGLLEMSEQGTEYHPVPGSPPFVLAPLLALAAVLVFMLGRRVFSAVRG